MLLTEDCFFTQHVLGQTRVLATLKLKLKKIHQQKSPRLQFDIDNLKDPEITTSFEARLGGKFAALNIFEEDINVLTDNIKGAVHERAI